MDAAAWEKSMQMGQPDDLLTRIRMEFVEMPDLKLTVRQAGRLWNQPDERCGQALELLVTRRFLVRTAGGAFLRCG
jgi:hypothetical protein